MSESIDPVSITDEMSLLFDLKDREREVENELTVVMSSLRDIGFQMKRIQSLSIKKMTRSSLNGMFSETHNDEAVEVFL